jgi:ubiquitin fusion degradation protein 1
MRNFACLSTSDIIEIVHNSIQIDLFIMDAQPSPDGISVIDTDLEVDFAAPLGYVEPTPQPRAPPPTMASKLGIKTEATVPQTATTDFGAFVGTGNSLGGKSVKGKGTTARKIEGVDEGSRILPTDRPRVMTVDTPDANSRVPAALNLPYGTLFFSYPVVPFGEAKRPTPRRRTRRRRCRLRGRGRARR